MAKKTKIIMYILLAIIILLLLAALGLHFYLNQPQFGRLPQGQRLARIEQSPHYRDGSFQNIMPTPMKAEDASYLSMIWNFLLRDKSNTVPPRALPALKTDLANLDRNSDILIWFGHSSYLLQVNGLRFLVDPVFCAKIPPIPLAAPQAFAGTDIYAAADMPAVDYVIISHDHWDHLDYGTMKQIDFGKVICGLGVGEHFEHWGLPLTDIIELDWDEQAQLAPGVTLHCFPARHFSGRSLWRNRSLWASYVLETPDFKVYFGGDGGYDQKTFTRIGQSFGGLDLAIVDNGQYDKDWPYVHMMPEQGLQARADLQARRLLPVHSAKYCISNHDWDDPLNRISQGGPWVITPMIGEIVYLRDEKQKFKQWWKLELDLLP